MRSTYVDGAEFVDMGQHRTDAARLRLEPVKAQERIEPDQPPARLMQAFHLDLQPGDVVAFQAVGDEKNDRALRQAPGATRAG